ncbi:MAG: CHAT domain-containing protein, partial [Bacteroidota bacterium]
NSSLEADLVVMNACNTGYGKILEGEGVMSLGRAFSYAGCKSVLMSLWLASDASSAQIIQDFYDYSTAGYSKSEALRLAKLDYAQSFDPVAGHPAFWSHLVLFGDTSPLFPEKANLWLIGGLLAGIMALVGVLIYRRQNRYSA